MPVITEMNSEDIPAVTRLVERYWAFEGIPGFAEDGVARALNVLLTSPGRGIGFVAREADETVGYLLAVYVFSLEHLGLTAEIDEFFVNPDYRDAGIGLLLLHHAEEAFIRADCSNVSLQIGASNLAARRFYHRQGYSGRSQFQLLEKDLRRSSPDES